MTQLNKLEDKIGIVFKSQTMLKQAFVHRSYINEHKDFALPSNEKLEFLGDSVLSMITSLHLFKQYPTYNEGIYTDIKAAIVKTDSLAHAARNLGLGQYLYLSHGEEENGGRDSNSILADCFEAVIAAIFLDAGFEKTRKFIEVYLFQNVLDDIVENKKYLPSKNLLQEYYQEHFKKLPVYKILSETGPQHEKTYTIGVFDGETLIGKGVGKSKKQAEEAAASSALKKI